MKFLQKISKALMALLVAGIVSVAGVLTQTSSVFADDIPAYRIQLSPAKVDIKLEPGKTTTGKFAVQNTGAESFDYKVSVAPYTVTDENYNPDYDNNGVYNDIVDWVSFSRTSGTLSPNESQDIEFSIKVPTDVPGGGQYAIILAEIDDHGNEGSGANITISKRVGILLYSEVNGVTRKTGKISENKISGILFNPPITATSIVENTGNTHTNARYVLQVYPLFGNEEVYTNEENPMTLTILPETRRFNSVSWDGAPHLGIFRVKQTVTLFDQTSVTEKVVVLIPLWFLFIILIIIFCVIFWIVSRIRNRNKY